MNNQRGLSSGKVTVFSGDMASSHRKEKRKKKKTKKQKHANLLLNRNR